MVGFLPFNSRFMEFPKKKGSVLGDAAGGISLSFIKGLWFHPLWACQDVFGVGSFYDADYGRIVDRHGEVAGVGLT